MYPIQQKAEHLVKINGKPEYYQHLRFLPSQQSVLRKNLWRWTIGLITKHILKPENYFTTPGDETVFGYQERWAEYRYHPAMITGKFRSTAAGTLDAWHLAQKVASRPALAPAFIVDQPPAYRDWETDRKSTRLNSSHITRSRMPSSA